MRRTHFDLRIDQAGRPHDQLDHLSPDLSISYRRGVAETKIGLRHATLLAFLEFQRPVVQRRRQAETELDQVFLARTIALVHGAELRER